MSLLVFCALFLWTSSTAFLAYSAYYDSLILAMVGKFLQTFVLLIGIWLLYLWFSVTAARINSRFIFSDLDKLETDEYVTMAYLSPLVMNGLCNGGWNLLTGDDMWSTHSEMTLLYFMAVHYFLFMSLTGIGHN